MIKKISFLFLILLIAGDSYAQGSEPTMIPQQIYVGDSATLILALPDTEQNVSQTELNDIVLTPLSGYLPSDPNIDFHKITLERRVTGNRLLIEFSAFTPGVLELPVIEIGDEYFIGLTVTVSSLINDRSSHILLGAAAALTIPGTALMLYSLLAFVVFLILFTILFLLKGRKFINKLRQGWKYYWLFSSIRKIEKQLRMAILKDVDKRIILDKLSDEFRIFLSNLIGINCRAMTAVEFELSANDEKLSYLQNPVNLPDYADFFRTCDVLRFSGADIDSQKIVQLLDDLKNILLTLENAKNSRQKEGKTT
ncbi:MAG: hypothetical protein LBC80_09330 [Treponema sp.]|jgi:hypothetical protein|nr:hypothetical protein [Treponema sp.]